MLATHNPIAAILDIAPVHQRDSMYITTRPVPSALAARIEGLIPDYCRSVRCLHGETDDDPVRYVAHRHEIEHVRRAISIARTEAETCELERRNDAALAAARAAR